MYIKVIDQLSRKVLLTSVPKRIISLVPSQTELLFDLGLADNIIGLTKFCTRPAEQVKNKIRVGGTKQLNIPLIRSLKPDLIIGNKEENEREQIELLSGEFPVWMSDIADLDDALGMINGIGQITNTAAKATAIAAHVKAGFNTLVPSKKQKRVAYLIWKNPFMTAGKDTFIDNMLLRCGFLNVIQQQRYPRVTSADLQHVRPDVVMLSSEPYPFNQKHIQAFEELLPDARIILADGEMFSWYGSRLLLAPQYFKQLIADLNS